MCTYIALARFVLVLLPRLCDVRAAAPVSNGSGIVTVHFR